MIRVSIIALVTVLAVALPVPAADVDQAKLEAAVCANPDLVAAIEDARYDVFVWSKLHDDPDSAGVDGQANRINRVNRVNRLGFQPYRRDLLFARERLASLEADLAQRAGSPTTIPPDVTCRGWVERISDGVVRRSRAHQIDAESVGRVARAFCQADEQLLGGDSESLTTAGARVYDGRRFVSTDGSEAWQVYVAKPVGVEFAVIVHADCARVR